VKYLSVCSGIEAATVAWHPLGWEPFAFAEIEKFPSAVLTHHYPHVPNLGDMTKFKDWPDAAIDVLVGGTPCQSFSVAGLRKGLADPRGNLALVYLAIADRYRPEWIVWENVPGVLSSEGGRDFGAIVGGMVELGYSPSWRVLDAQYVRVDGFPYAVPQRRRRVFIVGHLGDWRRAAAVLFERESLQGDTPPRRQQGQGVAPTISSRPTGGGGLGTDFDCDGGLVVADVASTLNAHYGEKWGLEDQHVNQGCPLFIAFAHQQGGNIDLHVTNNVGLTIQKSQGQAVAFDMRGRDGGSQFEGPHETANIRAASGGSSKSYVAQPWAVRRLTPRECERLQGFPDDYTLIPVRGKSAADGPRYKALGNSMAVNCMRWIGKRIAATSALPSDIAGGQA
jgi:DNA (cytosine-5)-methyltransferase 1